MSQTMTETTKAAENAKGATQTTFVKANTANGHSDAGEEAGFDFNNEKTELAALTAPPTFKTFAEEREYRKERLCVALRVFGNLGYDHQVAGHLTVRDPEHQEQFWVNPFGLAFSLMTVSDLICVNEEGKVIGGGKPGRRIVNVAGFKIHSSLHKARPDVVAICHSHSPYGKAWSTLGKPLPITTQDSCVFYNDCALLTSFGGVVVKGEESNLIAETLGKKKSIILQNHGILTCGTSIDSAVGWYIMLETQCQVALLASAAGEPIEIDEEQAAFTYKEIASERAGHFAASPYFQMAELEADQYRK